MARRKSKAGRDRLAIRRHVSPGARPGTLAPDPEGPDSSRVRVVTYGGETVEERTDVRPEDLGALVGRHAVAWVDVDGVGDPGVVERLGKVLGLHPLALEDTVNLYQRPKLDEYPANLFIVVRMATFDEHVVTEQLAMFLGEGFVVTFQGERPGDCLDPVRKRILGAQGRHRAAGADYLAYSIIDAVIDHYFPVLDELGASLEALEDELIAGPVRGAPERIRRAKQDLLVLRRTIQPLRDVVGALARDESGHVRPETRLFFRDCYDHAVQLLDVVNTYREIAGGMMDLYLSGVSNRMNEVMKFLTLVSTIFIPLTFVAGIYGMNFDTRVSRWNMPELESAYGYPVVVGLMVAMALTLLVYFRRKGWLAPTR